MSVLSDGQIRERIEDDDIVVEPFDEETQLQPASVDLRMGDNYICEDKDEQFEDCETLVFEPKTHYLATTAEWIKVPDDICARVEGRSSVGRMGLQVHTTAGWIDPGFEGEITFEVYNLSDEPIEIEAGQRVGQLVFLETGEPAEVPYGEQAGSKYQGQKGATETRIEQDED